MSSVNYQPRKVLVTGGAGFIGSHFIRYALGQDPNLIIVNLDLLTYAGSLKNLENLPDEKRHVFVKGDICDKLLVEKILHEYNIDTIVHFAAESHVDRSIEGPAPFIQTNVVGTFTLLEAARKAKLSRFHHISTDEVYGSLTPDAPAFTEQSPYAPNSPYSASKASSDHLVRAYYHTYQLPITMSHCSNNYGAYQHPEKFIPTVIRSCLKKQPIPIYGDGSNVRDWIYVEDHSRGIMDILTKGRLGETYHLGGQCEISNLQMAQMICKLMDESCLKLIHFVKDRAGHDWRYAMDISKIYQELNWQPAESLCEGLRETIQFYANAKELEHESH